MNKGWLLASGFAMFFGVVVWACGSDSRRGDDDDGSSSQVCGLDCAGAVSCSDGTTGTATADGDVCTIPYGSDMEASLSCDGTVLVGNSMGLAATGTWSGADGEVTTSVAGDSVTCTLTPG